MSGDLLGLVEECKGGKEEAWERLVAPCGKIIRGYLMKYCRGKAEVVDDITQLVWIKLLKGGIRDYRGTSQYQFLAYLKTVTINEANTHFRNPGKPKQEIPSGEGTHITNPKPSSQPSEARDEASGPEELAILKGEVEKLRQCLKALPLVQQKIAMMKAKDYKESEISGILGIPPGTVAVSYLRLKTKLRECIENRKN